MKTHPSLAFIGVLAVATTAAILDSHSNGAAQAPVTPARLARIATVDERFQSYNVEMAEVIGGNFWKPYDRRTLTAAKSAVHGASPPTSGAPPQQVGQDPTMFQARPPINLSNPRLRKLAAALGPAYMRTSGTWANLVYFHDSDTAAPITAPKGFQGVLTHAEWKGVVDFASAVDAKLVTSFTISPGVRDAAGSWTPVQASKIIAYTKAAGGSIAAAELFNEPDMPSFGGAPAGYNAASYTRDLASFRSFAKTTVPEMQIVGPGSVGEGVLMPAMGGAGLAAGVLRTEDMLSALPRPAFDIFSYHFYGAASLRCAAMGPGAQTTADRALTEEWLARTEREYTFYVELRDRFQAGTAVWITETADAACGGNPWAATFLDTFRYLDQLGRLARHGVAVVFHNTLASSEYGLLDQDTFAPRPNYWAALLWHRLMGTTVLDAGLSRPGFHVYAHCTAGQRGSVTLLAINTSRTTAGSVDVSTPADRYTLSARTLESGEVQLNGRELELAAGDSLPNLSPVREPAGRVAIAPSSITYLIVPDADNASCAGR
jgi:heparanase 1